MSGVLTGFVTVLALIAIGYIAARARLVPEGSDRVLARVVFYIAMPALLFVTMSEADPAMLFSPLLAGVGISVAASAALFAVLAPGHMHLREKIVGSLSACYVNAGHLGIPIAAYVLGDATLVAPVLFIQLLILAPLGVSALDMLGESSGGRSRPWLTPVTNPIVIGAVAGLSAGLVPWQIPSLIQEPVSLMAGAAVPLALFLYGISLDGAFTTGAVRTSRELWLVVAAKNFAHPLIAYLVGMFLLGLPTDQVLALTVLSALPTAQNLFVYSLRYDAGVVLTRSAVLVTTMISIPVLIAIVSILA